MLVMATVSVTTGVVGAGVGNGDSVRVGDGGDDGVGFGGEDGLDCDGVGGGDDDDDDGVGEGDVLEMATVLVTTVLCTGGNAVFTGDGVGDSIAVGDSVGYTTVSAITV